MRPNFMYYETDKPHGIRRIKASTFSKFCARKESGETWEALAAEYRVTSSTMRFWRARVAKFGLRAFCLQNRDMSEDDFMMQVQYRLFKGAA